jgi:hypothetical protein
MRSEVGERIVLGVNRVEMSTVSPCELTFMNALYRLVASGLGK